MPLQRAHLPKIVAKRGPVHMVGYHWRNDDQSLEARSFWPLEMTKDEFNSANLHIIIVNSITQIPVDFTGRILRLGECRKDMDKHRAEFSMRELAEAHSDPTTMMPLLIDAVSWEFLSNEQLLKIDAVRYVNMLSDAEVKYECRDGCLIGYRNGTPDKKLVHTMLEARNLLHRRMMATGELPVVGSPVKTSTSFDS